MLPDTQDWEIEDVFLAKMGNVVPKTGIIIIFIIIFIFIIIIIIIIIIIK